MQQAIPRATAPKGRNNVLYHFQEPNHDILGYFTHLASQGDIVQMGILPAYVINHPDLIQDVFIRKAKSFDKQFQVKFSTDQIFGTQNTFSADGDVWRVLRKAEQPAFHMQRIQSYFDVMLDRTALMIDGWSDGQDLNFTQLMLELTLRITAMTLFGKDITNDRAGEAIIKVLDIFTDRITNPIPIPIWIPIQSNREMKSEMDILNSLLQPIIEARKASGEDTGDILSMLLNAQKHDTSGVLTDAQIQSEVYMLFAAGYEVTANTTAFTLYLICQHPDVYQKLQAEIDTALSDANPTLEALNQMSYLEQVIKESMRLMPITAIIGRQANEDVEIGGYSIARNVQVFAAPWTLHRCETYFPDPETFDPDRFSSEREKDIPKNAYIPFSTGPRICLGNAFAMLQMKTTLSKMLYSFHFEIPADYSFEPYWRFNTRLKHDLQVIVNRR
ncbi:MAG: cytochrome P450 [Anaerolineae bacterium]